MKSVDPFITGFIENNDYLGRPADVLVLKDGAWLAASPPPPPIIVRATRLAHLSSDHPGDVGALIYGLPAKASVAKFYCEAMCRGDSRNGGMGGSVRGLSRPPLPTSLNAARRRISRHNSASCVSSGVPCASNASSVSRAMLRDDVFLRETLSLCSFSSLSSKYA